MYQPTNDVIATTVTLANMHDIIAHMLGLDGEHATLDMEAFDGWDDDEVELDPNDPLHHFYPEDLKRLSKLSYDPWRG